MCRKITRYPLPFGTQSFVYDSNRKCVSNLYTLASIWCFRVQQVFLPIVRPFHLNKAACRMSAP